MITYLFYLVKCIRNRADSEGTFSVLDMNIQNVQGREQDFSNDLGDVMEQDVSDEM